MNNNTFKKILACIAVICVCIILPIFLIAQYSQTNYPDFPEDHYAQVFRVVDAKEKLSDYRYILTLEDYEGNQFTIYSDKYECGDYVVCIMDGKETPSIEDDVIYEDYYGGKYYTPLQMEEAIENAYEAGYEACLNDDFNNARG